MRIEQSDWLKIRRRRGILIHSAGQGLNNFFMKSSTTYLTFKCALLNGYFASKFSSNYTPDTLQRQYIPGFNRTRVELLKCG